MHRRIVGIRRNDAPGNGFGGLRLRQFGLDVGEPHGHAQFQRVGILEPLGDVAVVDGVVAAPCLGRKRRVAAQDLDGFIQLLEHLRVDRLLRVVGYIDRLVALELRVGYRTVGVRHTMHDGHAQQPGEGYGHLVVRTADDAL